MGEAGERELLDSLSGFEFEELMRDVFREMGYINVEIAGKTADRGKDIEMKKVEGGVEKKVIVECKHTDVVGRPVVQKLHSAVSTDSYPGEKIGMIATSGRFTEPACDEARDITQNPDEEEIILLDGEELREIGQRIGLDLYSGKIEILCNESLPAPRSTNEVTRKIERHTADIRALEPTVLGSPEISLRFIPILVFEAGINAVFSTSVGVIHRVNTRESSALYCGVDGTEYMDAGDKEFLSQTDATPVEIDVEELRDCLWEVEVMHFGKTKSDYKTWIKDHLIERHSEVVYYTGDNNVTYNKECTPSSSDIDIHRMEPLYIPLIETEIQLKQYRYTYSYLTDTEQTRTKKDEFHRCIQCNTDKDTTYTYCRNCSSINCKKHTKTERLTGEPICTGCAVTQRFFLRKKYFYTEENKAEFQELYNEMPVYRKPLENKPLMAGVILGLLFLVGYFTLNPDLLGF